jgi:hypothetical protein
MKLILLMAFLAVGVCAQDVKVLLENDSVKVMQIREAPGDKLEMNDHLDTVVVALNDQRRQMTTDKTAELNLKAGQAMWLGNVKHSEKNIGTTDADLLVVEIKQSGGRAEDFSKWPASLDAVTAAPRNHKVLLENDRVRVLSVTVEPGEMELPHRHSRPSVIYVISRDDILDTDLDGKVLLDTRAALNAPSPPYAVWMPSQPPHHVLNRAKTAVRLIRIELK